MQVSWQNIARHAALPLATVAAGSGATAIVFWLQPDDYVNLVLFITVLAVAAWLLVASAFELISLARHQPLGIARSAILAIPAGLYVAGLAGLQSMRLVGPLTLVTGLCIVILAEYVLWPRNEL
ncbi:MAG: hypothetical protein RMM58_07730 [Chloroflexota bacterium]|nr:hypothetical protein [Dehalococcoidia bacterium]MDW8253751.1 hypothetical protein [Chloroflexota bacterium]